jgi:hypothetical protein
LCEKRRSIIDGKEEQVYPTNNKNGMLTGLVTYYELPTKTCFPRKDRGRDRSEGKTRKKV